MFLNDCFLSFRMSGRHGKYTGKVVEDMNASCMGCSSYESHAECLGCGSHASLREVKMIDYDIQDIELEMEKDLSSMLSNSNHEFVFGIRF